MWPTVVHCHWLSTLNGFLLSCKSMCTNNRHIGSDPLLSHIYHHLFMYPQYTALYGERTHDSHSNKQNEITRNILTITTLLMRTIRPLFHWMMSRAYKNKRTRLLMYDAFYISLISIAITWKYSWFWHLVLVISWSHVRCYSQAWTYSDSTKWS